MLLVIGPTETVARHSAWQQGASLLKAGEASLEYVLLAPGSPVGDCCVVQAKTVGVGKRGFTGGGVLMDQETGQNCLAGLCRIAVDLGQDLHGVAFSRRALQRLVSGQ